MRQQVASQRKRNTTLPNRGPRVAATERTVLAVRRRTPKEEVAADREGTETAAPGPPAVKGEDREEAAVAEGRVTIIRRSNSTPLPSRTDVESARTLALLPITPQLTN